MAQYVKEWIKDKGVRYVRVRYGSVRYDLVPKMSSNNYDQMRPRIRVNESARNRLQWFKNEYDLPLDRVYGFAFEELANQIENSDGEEIAEAIETNE